MSYFEIRVSGTATVELRSIADCIIDMTQYQIEELADCIADNSSNALRDLIKAVKTYEVLTDEKGNTVINKNEGL